jgi:sulfatase modifying factor 1
MGGLATLAASGCSVVTDLGDPRALRPHDAAMSDAAPDDVEQPGWDASHADAASVDADGTLPCDAGSCRPTHACPDLAICGPSGSEDCCLSLLVEGGTSYRHNDPGLPATVSDFRLDKYEVTIGRYRKFVAAMSAGWKPAAGSGKHDHLSAGGLFNTYDEKIEAGWDPAMDTELPSDQRGWDAILMCPGSIWTPAPVYRENMPVGCVDLAQAYAFCIWDGGFLPSYAEWNYAISGGAEQRKYPWGNDPPDANHANYCVTPCVGTPAVVGSKSPLGDGLWGQSDLAGNVWEWLLDTGLSASVPCKDCMTNQPGLYIYDVGGAYNSGPDTLGTDYYQNYDSPMIHGPDLGFRCARAP